MKKTLAVLALSLPTIAFAIDETDDTPPEPTKTTTECADGTVWDDKAGACVAPKQSSLDDDALYHAARELAHAGQFEAAIGALAAMSDPSEDRVLTYLGFTHRRAGNVERGMAYYRKALAQNPDNLRARSYLGQAYLKLGALDAAREQLTEIRARGGRMTWAEFSLSRALASGRGFSY